MRAGQSCLKSPSYRLIIYTSISSLNLSPNLLLLPLAETVLLNQQTVTYVLILLFLMSFLVSVVPGVQPVILVEGAELI